MSKIIYAVEHRANESHILSRGIRLGSFYSAELAERVVKFLNEDPPKAPPDEVDIECLNQTGIGSL